MRLCKCSSMYLFIIFIIFFASIMLISCGTTEKHKIYPGQAPAPENVAILEEDLSERGRCWTLLIDEEDVHEKPINFWSLKGKNSRAFEVLPGIHNIVVVTNETRGGGGGTYEKEYALSPVSMTFKAEGGHKYLIVGEVEGSGRWRSWIKDASSGEIVSKAIPPDPADAEVVGKKCRVDSNYIISSIDINDILYIPGSSGRMLRASDITKNPVGGVLAGTIYKTRESGRWQYKKAYLLSPLLLGAGKDWLILVPREGLRLEDYIYKDEVFRQKLLR